MMSFTNWIVKALLAVHLLLSMGCGENWALKEETFMLSEENEDWVPETLGEDSFTMIDNNDISHGFVMTNEDHYMDKSWGGYFGITTHMTFTEYRYRAYTSTYGITFHCSIRASTWEPYGDEIYISVNDIEFRYDLALDTVTMVATPSCRLSYSETSEGYEGDEIISTAEVLDTLTAGGIIYEDVLSFRLEDCPTSRSSFTIREICYAKGVGLVRFEMQNGTVYERTNSKK